MFLNQDAAVENLLNSASSSSKASLFFCQQFLCDSIEAVENNFEHYFARVTYQTDGSVVLAAQGPMAWRSAQIRAK